MTGDRDPRRTTWRAATRVVCSSEFLAPVIVIGVPYALAAFVQDVVATRLDTMTLTYVGICLAALTSPMVVGLWLWTRRARAREARRADDLARALDVAKRDLASVARRLDREVYLPARHLATLAKWLDRGNRMSLDAPARHRLADIRARAERVRDSVAGIASGPSAVPVPARISRARRSRVPSTRLAPSLPPVVLRRA